MVGSFYSINPGITSSESRTDLKELRDIQTVLIHWEKVINKHLEGIENE